MRPPGRINQGGTAGFPVPQTGFPREARMGDQKTAVFCFPEFLPYLGHCQFTSCTHTKDKGCAILQALADGEIEPKRHESYVAFYESVKDLKDWETG